MIMLPRTRRLRFRNIAVVWMVSGLLVLPVLAENEEEVPSDPPSYTAASLRALFMNPLAVPAGPQEVAVGRPRSVPLAFSMSAVVPGLGQAYNRQWVKAAVAIAVEAALVGGYAVWRSEGIDGREAYQAFAHAGWSPARYASWLNDYAASLDIGAPVIDLPTGIDFTNPGAWTEAQRQAVQTMIVQVRRVEDMVTHPNGASFSHRLPFFGEQQYYELIGKYAQFAPGWDDYGYWILEDNGPYLHPDQPDRSDQFLAYADDHGRANGYLRRASRLSILFVANHLIAAVDAAVFAKVNNDRISTDVQLGYDVLHGTQTTASLRIRL